MLGEVRGAAGEEGDVNAAVDRMWSAVASFKEAQKMPQETPQEMESNMAAAMEEFCGVSTDVVDLLNRTASR